MVHTFVPPRSTHESFSHVSFPNSPGAWNRVELPHKFSSPRIERSHVARRTARLPVGNNGAGDHEILENDRRRSDSANPVWKFVGDAGPKINRPAIAEICHRFAAAGIQSKQPAVQRAHENAALPSRTPIGYAAVNKKVVGPVFVEFGIETPKFFASLRLQRHGPPERSRQIEQSVYHQRRAFESGADGHGAAITDLSGVIRPGYFQLGDVLLVDLLQRRVL